MRLKIALGLAVVLILLCAIAGLSEKQPNSATSVTTEASSNSTIEVTVSEEVEESIDTSTESDTIETSSESEEVIPPISEAPDEESVEEIIIPDIITTIEVKLYNDTSTGFNLVDGRAYIEDIVMYLRMYAPDNMLTSAAAAMSYTEGGAGKQGVYTRTNNCFGIRAYASWDGYVYARSTGLVYKDYQTAINHGASDFFRAYNSMKESVADYVRLMTGDYYCEVLNAVTPDDYFTYVLSKGYGEKELHSMWMYLVSLYNLSDYDNASDC